eukprot:Hpha_TRINITY_DN31233_c0_g1::TRINITY_DN31233_c0_g1_i1::g.2399::m.2399
MSWGYFSHLFGGDVGDFGLKKKHAKSKKPHVPHVSKARHAAHAAAHAAQAKSAAAVEPHSQGDSQCAAAVSCVQKCNARYYPTPGAGPSMNGAQDSISV